jgi:anti-sigma B factor antagonist
MKLEIEEYPGRFTVVRPFERIDAFSAPELRERLLELIAVGNVYFVVDLSQTPFLDSAGMAALVNLLKRCRQLVGDVALVWPTEDAAKRILRLTKFDRVFTMFDDVQGALSAWQTPSGLPHNK